MNQEEWLTCTDPVLMLQSIATTAVERRRFALACVRRHGLTERFGWKSVCDLIEQNIADSPDSKGLSQEVQAAVDECGGYGSILQAILDANAIKACERVVYLFHSEAPRYLGEIAGETFHGSWIAAWTARKQYVDNDPEMRTLQAQYGKLEEACKELDQ